MFRACLRFCYHFLYFSIVILSGLCLSFLALQSLLGHTYIPLHIAESVSFLTNPWWIYPLSLLFVLGLFFLRSALKSLTRDQLFFICASLYLVAGIYLIAFSPGNLRADARAVYQAALAFNQGDFHSLTTLGGYLYLYPHQLGLVTLECLYTALTPSTHFIFGINLVLSLFILYLLYQITYLLTKKDSVCRLTILLSFLFFPHFFFILFAYGVTPGLACCLFSLYLFLKWEHQPRWSLLIGASLSISLACLLRNNYQIFVLTLIGIFFLSFCKQYQLKKLLPPLLILLSIFLSTKGLHFYYQQTLGHPLSSGTPKIAWVTMGLRDDPHRSTLGGWYDGYNKKILRKNGYDEKKAKEAALSDLKHQIKHLIDQPDYAIIFFYQKIRSTWTEPTFQSIWTGPQLERNQQTQTRLLQSIYEEKSAYHFLHYAGLILIITIYGFSTFFTLYKLLLARQPLSPFQIYPLIFFLGGFSFHIIWETKSQYVYIYVLLLIPMAAQGLDVLYRLLLHHRFLRHFPLNLTD